MDYDRYDPDVMAEIYEERHARARRRSMAQAWDDPPHFYDPDEGEGEDEAPAELLPPNPDLAGYHWIDMGGHDFMARWVPEDREWHLDDAGSPITFPAAEAASEGLIYRAPIPSAALLRAAMLAPPGKG